MTPTKTAKVRQWMRSVSEFRPRMEKCVVLLGSKDVFVEKELPRGAAVSELAYIAQFKGNGTIVTIRFILKDWQTDSDVVVTNMTTMPEEFQRRGHGSAAIQSLLAWARTCEFNEVRATQVGTAENEQFWEKNGFVKCPAPNPCNDFVFSLSQ